ncbi:MAG TPA: MFS transporter, partial [Vicinamibacterales bacterium]
MHGLYVLWWVQQKHVSVAAVAAILAAGDLFVTLLELPTGWLADRWGHRASLIAGSLLQIAGMLFAGLGNGIPGVLASSLVIAAGDAFRSGADQALLYRSCGAVGDQDFQRREARARALQLVALVLMVLAGGAIVSAWGFATGWFVETLFSVVGLAIAFAMVEPPPSTDMIPHDNGSPIDGGVTTSRRQETVRALGSLIALMTPAAVVHALAS